VARKAGKETGKSTNKLDTPNKLSYWKESMLIGLIIYIIIFAFCLYIQLEYKVPILLSKPNIFAFFWVMGLSWYGGYLFNKIANQYKKDGWLFLKPSFLRVLFSVLLSIISFFVTLIAGFPTLVVPYALYMLMFKWPISFLIPLIVVPYPFACYIRKNRKWFKPIILCSLTLGIISVTIMYAVSYNNKQFGHYCKNDSDCGFGGPCGGVPINSNWIDNDDPFTRYMCRGGPPPIAICENNRCGRKDAPIPEPSAEELACEGVKFSFKTACVSESTSNFYVYKVTVVNDGNKDVIGWQVRLYQSYSYDVLVESTDALAKSQEGVINAISNITPVRAIEVEPKVSFDGKEKVCPSSLYHYKNIIGSPQDAPLPPCN
jgi:hypothetical protein